MVYAVLVPGAGAPAGINTIKSLRMANFRGQLIATDSNALSAGFLMSDAYEIMPETKSPSFLENLFTILSKHKVEVLMPSSGFDIYPYSENRKKLQEVGVTAVVSDRDSLEVCSDKMLTYQSLVSKFELPFTTLDPDKIHSFPFIAKPRFGKGGRDFVTIHDDNDLNYVKSKFKNDTMIFQEFLPGIEYTVDVLSDLNKIPIMAVPRIRLETKAGISTKGKVVHDSELEETCMKIAKAAGIRGPCCIQMKQSMHKDLKLVEINPRLGGGTIFATLAGANFPKMILDMVEGKQVNPQRFSEITVVRYFEEAVFLIKSAVA